MRARVSRAAGVAVLAAGLLFGAASTNPAAATPKDERAALATMKSTWPELTRKQQRTVCLSYRTDRADLVSRTVRRIERDPGGQALDTAGWTRVVTKYLRWACSGDGGTPR